MILELFVIKFVASRRNWTWYGNGQDVDLIFCRICKRIYKYRTSFLIIKFLYRIVTKIQERHPYFCLMKAFLVFGLSIAVVVSIGCNGGEEPSPEQPGLQAPAISYSILSSVPHDTSYFTEGYEYYNNTLLESTGNYGTSKLVQADPKTGKVVKELSLPAKEFGEGITVLHDTIYQLTWKENIAHLYKAKDFKKIGDIRFNAEGWGLTNDGKQLIASDGSNNLYFYEPSTLRLLRVQSVTENGTPAVNINELEYVNGFVYANQWQYNYILKINPQNGEVVGKLDLTDLVNKVQSEFPYLDTKNNAVLNGIAYNPGTKKFLITGKDWPKAYEIDIPH